MTIVQRMREQLRGAMKARDTTKTTFLRYWIAGLTLGTGEEMTDDAAIKRMRSVLKEAQAVGVQWYFIEDESETPMDNIPKSVAYIKSLGL